MYVCDIIIIMIFGVMILFLRILMMLGWFSLDMILIFFWIWLIFVLLLIFSFLMYLIVICKKKKVGKLKFLKSLNYLEKGNF